MAIVGTRHSIYGVRNDVNLPELAYESIKETVDEAKIGLDDIDLVVVGNVGG